MSEVYTVEVGVSTPVELTGGRVGSLMIQATTLYVGGSDMSASFDGSGNQTVDNGVVLSSNTGDQWMQLLVSSPDEIYLLKQGGEATASTVFKVFHNR